VVGLARDDDDACGVTVRVRDGKVLGRVHHFLEGVAGRVEDEILTAYLVRCHLPSEDRARRCYLPSVPADLEALTQLDPHARWSVARRGLGRRLADLAEQNARHLLETLRLETFEGVERTEDPVYAVGRDLGMTVVPRRMVCVDVSTAQGRDTVGAIVWFENGRPQRSEYRTYRVRSVAGPDDVAAIGEVVERFLRRRVLEGRPLPDLLLVDGGRGQLAAVESAAQASGAVGVGLASLAKRDEEVFLPGRDEPLRLSRRSPALQLLQRARDEAHRRALGFNRRRRTARTVTSELLSIPMIGEKRRRALLRQFGSVAGVRHASRDEIAAVPGFSVRLAEHVLEHLGGGG
jgi:excinuclease ABC subunit C